ncbi:MAG: tetratricopeptide repeat protein [Magnetococcales bacterium]|nr:tetratricopeptide repeat protein [Magnetococcales bacterium]
MRTRVLLTLLFVLGGGMVAHAEQASELIAAADRYWAAEQMDQAQQAFEAAVAAEPNSALAQLRLAGFQLSRQQLEACIAGYQRVIGLDPNNAKAWMGLGLAYLHTDRRELARSSFEEAARVDPKQQESLAPLLAKLQVQ